MKGLNSFETPQEKLDALVKKYTEIYDENRKLQVYNFLNHFISYPPGFLTTLYLNSRLKQKILSGG